ncbi:MAG: diaminopimelate epimerase, partial [Rhodothermales bacterium]|nr:diaminopimelate epimerase [Rhodothermales bacterium]
MMKDDPRRTLVVEFTKMSGAGNDFIVLDNRFYFFGVQELSRLAQTYCARRTGVGADGLLAMENSETADFRMRYFNADGSVGSMCGNGARCLVKYAANAGIESRPLRFETDAGDYSAELVEEEVRLFIPAYQGFEQLPADDHGPERCYLWTGTEHLVVFSDDVAKAPVGTLGPRLRQTNPPAGANVNFAQVDGEGLILRTWEKGVEGETLACGTGATAAAAAA